MRKVICFILMICMSLCVCACGGSEGSGSASKNSKELSCSEEVSSSDYDDCIVQVLDMVFDFNMDDVTNPMYFFEKIENSSYDIQLTATAEGLVQAGEYAGVEVVYNNEYLMAFYADNDSNKTVSIKDCRVSTVQFYPLIYTYYELYQNTSVPTVSNMWYANGTSFYNSEVLYGDLMDSIEKYSPKEYAGDDITKIFIDVVSENKKSEIDYAFYVDNDNGKLKHSFMRIKLK